MKTAIFAAMAAALVSVPAYAQSDSDSFVGPRVGITTGYDKMMGHDGVTYGVDAGYDLALGSRLRAGVDVALADSSVEIGSTHASRDLSASARLGYVVTPKLLAYGKLGYANSRFEDASGNNHVSHEGVRYGAGMEYAVTPRTYLSAEYQRTEYESGVGGRDAAMVGVGLRF